MATVVGDEFRARLRASGLLDDRTLTAAQRAVLEGSPTAIISGSQADGTPGGGRNAAGLDSGRSAAAGSGEVDDGHAADAAALAARCVEVGLITAWQAEQLLAGHSAFFLGKYRLEDRLGAGGMGLVFRAWDTVLARPVALKIVHPDWVAAGGSSVFLAECRTLAQLDHPNVVGLYDADRIGGLHVVVMPILCGMTLADILKSRGPLPVPIACEFIRQSALGLEHLRERGFVHRDIKPGNIFVCRADGGTAGGTGTAATGTAEANAGNLDGGNQAAAFVVRLVDVGLARLVSRPVSGRSDSRVRFVGTPDYQAPEQIRDPDQVDVRSDLYSLGLTLYELLSGRRPFDGKTAIDRMLVRLLAPPRPLRDRVSGLPEPLYALVDRLLERSPMKRLDSPRAVAETLAEFADGSAWRWDAAPQSLHDTAVLSADHTPQAGGWDTFEASVLAAVARLKRTPVPERFGAGQDSAAPSSEPHSDSESRSEGPSPDQPHAAPAESASTRPGAVPTNAVLRSFGTVPQSETPVTAAPAASAVAEAAAAAASTAPEAAAANGNRNASKSAHGRVPEKHGGRVTVSNPSGETERRLGRPIRFVLVPLLLLAVLGTVRLLTNPGGSDRGDRPEAAGPVAEAARGVAPAAASSEPAAPVTAIAGTRPAHESDRAGSAENVAENAAAEAPGRLPADAAPATATAPATAAGRSEQPAGLIGLRAKQPIEQSAGNEITPPIAVLGAGPFRHYRAIRSVVVLAKSVEAITVSDDGSLHRFALTVTDDGRKAGQKVERLPAADGEATAVAAGSQTGRIAVGTRAGTVELRSPDGRQVLTVLPVKGRSRADAGHAAENFAECRRLVFDAAEQYLAASFADGRAIVWDLRTRPPTRLFEFPASAAKPPSDSASPEAPSRSTADRSGADVVVPGRSAGLSSGAGAPAVAFHPHKPWFAVADRAGRVTCRDLISASVVAECTLSRSADAAGEEAGPSLSFSPTTGRLAIAGFGRGVVVWNVTTDVRQTIAARRRATATAVAHTADGRLLLGDTRGQVLTVNPLTGKTDLLGRHRGPALAVAAVGRDYAVSAGADHELRVWNLSIGAAAISSESHRGTVTSATFTPGGRLLISSGADGTLRMWDAADNWRHVRTLETGDEYLELTAVSPDGALVAAAGYNGTYLGPLAGPLKKLPGESGRPLDVRFRTDASGRLRLQVLQFRRLQEWDAGDPMQPRTAVDLPPQPAKNFKISVGYLFTDGRRAVLAFNDREAVRALIQIVDTTTSRPIAAPIPVDSAVWDLAELPDSRFVAAAGSRLLVADLNTGEVLRREVLPDGTRSSVTVSTDGSRVAVGREDGSLEVWRRTSEPSAARTSSPSAKTPPQDAAKSGRPPLQHVRTIRFTNNSAWLRSEVWVHRLRFTPDNAAVVTANTDGTLFVIPLR